MKLFPVKTMYKLLAFFLCMAFSNSNLIGQIDFEILNGGSDICVGDSTLLSIDASVDSVQWSPTTGVSMTNSLATFVSPVQNTTYFATLFSGGVTTNVRFEVGVFSAPELGNNITVCENAILNFDLSDLTNPADYSLTSTGNFAIGEPSMNIFSVNVGTGNIGTFDLVANSVCGQSDTIQVTVINGAATSLVLNATDLTVCPGGEVNLSATSTSGNTSFEWFSNGTSISTSNAITENPTTTTTYVVNAIAGACAVPSVDSVLVTVNNPPSIVLPETINGCENDIIELGNNIAQVGATYSWQPDDNIIDPTVANAELLVVEDGTYILTATNGCTIQDTVDVILIPNDIDIPEDTLFLCKGESIEINWTTNPPNDDVVWTDIEGVLLSNVGNPFVVSPLDVVTFVGTVENNGCTFSDTVTIQVDSLPDFPELELIELDMNPPICQGDTVLLQDNPVFAPNLYPDLTFQWFTGDSTNVPAIPGQLDGFLTADSLLQILFIGTESMPYNRLNINGACTSISAIDVEVIPILEIDITPLDEVCPGDAFTIFGNPISPDPANPVDADDLEEWEWMTSSGTVEPADDPEPLLTIGQQDANISVSAMFMGCPAMGMATIPVVPVPLVTLPNQTTICPGDALSLNTSSGTVLDDYTITWTSSATNNNDGFGGQENSINPVVSPIVTTTYTMTLSHPECGDIFQEVTIDVFDALGSLPDLNFVACPQESINISIENLNFDLGPGGQVTWVPQSGGVPIEGTNFDMIFQESTFYNIFVENQCTVGPQMVGFATVIVPDGQVEIVCDSTAIFSGQVVPFTVFEIDDNATYTWTSDLDSGGGFSNPTGSATNFQVPQGFSGNITIEVTASTDGCETNSSKVISVVNVVLPNIFTPGLNVNNVYRLRVVDAQGEPLELDLNISNLQIYDRWGNKVYDNDNDAQEWDGNIDGQPAPSDVYVVTATIQVEGGGEIQMSTDLTLLR